MIKFRVSFIFNILIFALTLFATIAMIIGFEFMEGVKVLSETNFYSFKYFTVDSNVFAGITAVLILLITWGFSLGLWALGNIFSKSKSC